MNVPWETLLPYGGGGLVIFVAGGYFVVKIIQTVRNGRKETPPTAPKCPADDTLERINERNIRQEESFRAMIHSWDRVAGAIDEQTKAIRKTGETHAEALVKVAEVLTKRRDGDG